MAALGLASIGLARAALAQPRPLRLVLPQARGSLTDRIARLLVAEFTAVSRRAVGVEYLAGAAPRDDALLLSPVAPLLGPLRARGGGTVPAGLVPLLPIATTPLVVVSGHGGYAQLLPLAIAARRHPGSISWGIAGAGSSAHLAMLAMADQVAGSFRAVLLPNAAACVEAAIAGRVAVTAAPAPLVADAVRAGRLAALVVTGPERLALLPDAPAAPESAVSAGLDIAIMTALFAPRAMPAATFAALRDAFAAARAAPGFLSGLPALGSHAVEGDGAMVTALAAREASRWHGIVERFTLQ